MSVISIKIKKDLRYDSDFAKILLLPIMVHAIVNLYFNFPV